MPAAEPAVFDRAADLIDQRGLCKAYLYAHHAPVSQQATMTPGGRIRGTSTVGAIASACVQLDFEDIAAGTYATPRMELPYLEILRSFAQVGSVVEIEAGKATGADVAKLLRRCAEWLRSQQA